jgi:hypothetical protein
VFLFIVTSATPKQDLPALNPPTETPPPRSDSLHIMPRLANHFLTCNAHLSPWLPCPANASPYPRHSRTMGAAANIPTAIRLVTISSGCAAECHSGYRLLHHGPQHSFCHLTIPPRTHQVPRPSDDKAHSCLGFSRNFVAVTGWELPLKTWLLGLLLQLVPPLHVALLHARAGFQLPGSRPPPAGAAVVGKVIVLDGCRCLGDLHALATIHTAGKARSHRHSPPLPRIAHGAALP